MSLINTDCNRYIFVKKVLVFFIKIFFTLHFILWFSSSLVNRVLWLQLDASPKRDTVDLVLLKNVTCTTHWIIAKQSYAVGIIQTNTFAFDLFCFTVYMRFLCRFFNSLDSLSCCDDVHYARSYKLCVFIAKRSEHIIWRERRENEQNIFLSVFYAFQFIGLRCAHGLQWHCKYTIQCRVISNYALAWFIFKFFFFVFNNDLCPIQLNIPMHIRGLSCAIGARAHIVHCALQSEHNLNMDNLNINNLDLCCSFSNHLMHFFVNSDFKLIFVVFGQKYSWRWLEVVITTKFVIHIKF